MALKEKGIAAEYLSSTQATHVKNKVIWLLCVFWSLCIYLYTTWLYALSIIWPLSPVLFLKILNSFHVLCYNIDKITGMIVLLEYFMLIIPWLWFRSMKTLILENPQ